jgi:hypothetical protein
MTMTTLRPCCEGLAQHETGLGLRAVIGVDEQQHAVDHAEGALDLAAEVGVSGGVDDVDGLVLPVDGGVLGLDGDALLLLEVHGVHGAFLDLLVGAVDAAFLEEFVDEGGLPVVDVGDNGDVADVLVHVSGTELGTRNAEPGTWNQLTTDGSDGHGYGLVTTKHTKDTKVGRGIFNRESRE